MNAADSAQKSYEDRLGDAFETLLGGGVDSLDALAAGLNRTGMKPPRGAVWTADSLAAELKKLAE